ncbi:uncharacterized protein SOCG_06306 [Schizosaccharomyces octosporus yFS286]|uniref:Uncharacterized protein n=1 Tax=Schizosaccharomyces octosporus (strain yFS286) TaxID=483514 RepID=S9PPA8_SCHOY|nr:uncharacterized protein SOCG_06306 [Schizosaccharomyces octosporus yFS286]EPX71051.1 hypothetical protein SOCG_06306 [Schizosaccharomyces octosporus yFS286]
MISLLETLFVSNEFVTETHTYSKKSGVLIKNCISPFNFLISNLNFKFQKKNKILHYYTHPSTPLPSSSFCILGLSLLLLTSHCSYSLSLFSYALRRSFVASPALLFCDASFSHQLRNLWFFFR